MRGSGHIEDLGDGKWRLRVDDGRDPVTGKRRQKSRNVRGSERKAKQELARFLNELDIKTDRGTNSRTVGDLCHDWLEQARPNLSPNTAMEFDNSLRRYVLPHLAAIPIAKLRAWDIDAVYRHLLAKGGKGGKALAPATVYKAHTVLRLALDQAVRWHWITDNPALHASPPKVRQPDLTPPDAAGCRALIEAVDSRFPEWGVYIRLAAATGARRSELCALRWGAVDFDKSMIAISRAIIYDDTGTHDREYPKTAAGRRRIALDPSTVAKLRDHRRWQQETALAAGTRPIVNAYLFSTKLDGAIPWHPHTVTRRFSRLRVAAGQPKVRLHDVRHFVATQLIGGGMDPVAVAGRLGHSDPRVTMKVYAKWLPARDQESAAILGDLLAEQAGS